MTKEAEKFIAKQKESLIRINTAALNAIDKEPFTFYSTTLTKRMPSIIVASIALGHSKPFKKFLNLVLLTGNFLTVSNFQGGAIENDNDVFSEKTSDFYKNAMIQFDQLLVRYTSMDVAYKDVFLYFGEKAKDMKPDGFFSIFVKFMSDWEAHVHTFD
ncbi:hypothetical protein PS6_007998 [Mucor atramentarius]